MDVMLKKSKHESGLFLLLVPIIVILFIIAAAVSYFFLDMQGYGRDLTAKEVIKVTTKKLLSVPTPTPTPFAFQEMTIPHLRNREYVSELGNLEKLSENSSFTSYLTSYDSDGFRVDGYLTIPKGEKPKNGWPAVVFVHGYIPPTEYRTTKNYVSYADALADDGLVVFKIDLRGHDESEGEAFGAYYSEYYVVDTLNAYSALESANFVDPEKIGLWGHSMAGNIVFRSLAAMPTIPKVVIWAGAVYTYEDFSDYRISDNSYQPPPQQSERRKRREELFDTYGEFDPESNFWKQIPGTNFLDETEGAIQIHHALDDNVVKIGYSRNLMSVLNNTNIEHELFEYPNGGHNLTGTSFTRAMQRSADFFKK